MTTWNVHAADGRYVGQAEAIAAATAFCMCMELVGRRIVEGNIRSTERKDGSHLIKYEDSEFIVSVTSSSPFGLP